VVSGGTDVAIYRIDPVPRQLVDITARLITPRNDAWGVCLYRNPMGRFYVFTTANNGEIEACTVDDFTGYFYVSEQDVAVWRYAAEPTASTDTRTTVVTTYLVNDGYLVPDIGAGTRDFKLLPLDRIIPWISSYGV
jgi:myo-inositol-hexaphosphate 3-phosphohydrolase